MTVDLRRARRPDQLFIDDRRRRMPEAARVSEAGWMSASTRRERWMAPRTAAAELRPASPADVDPPPSEMPFFRRRGRPRPAVNAR